MKSILAGLLTLAVILSSHIPLLKQKKRIILLVFGLGMIALFSVYNYRTLSHIIPFYHPVNQTIYQKDFLADGGYTDAFLDEFLKEKTVYTPDDALDVSDQDPNDPRLYAYYHANNMWNYLESVNAKIVKDSSLNSSWLIDRSDSFFEYFGSANDLMRYTFPFTKYEDKLGNGYYYYWYYSAHMGDSNVFICTKDLECATDIIILWSSQDQKIPEDYYILSKEQFKSLSALPQQQQGDE